MTFNRWATFCVVAIIYLALPNLYYPPFLSPNDRSRLALTRAIVEHHAFWIDPYVGQPSPNNAGDLALYGGHFYSDKAVGLSFAAVPVLACLRLFAPRASIFTMLLVARLFTVTTPALIALWVILKRCRTSFAVLAVVGLYLGSVFFPQALTFNGHVPMTLAICGAAALVGRAEFRDADSAMAGLLSGVAILLDFTAGIAAAALLVVVAIRTASIRRCFIVALCCAAIGSVQLLVNAHCFSGPFDFAYHHMFDPADQSNRSSGFFGIGTPRLDAVVGLTFGGMRGMFVHSPFLLLAIPAVFMTFAKGNRDPIRIWAVAMCAAYFYLNAALVDWEGGWSLGPRYLTLIYALLTYLLVDWYEHIAGEASRRVWQPLLVVGVTWSVLLHLASMTTWSMPPPLHFLPFPALQISAYLILRGVFAPNVLGSIGVPIAVAVALVVLLAVSVIVLNGGRRVVPAVAVATLIFIIALSRAAPPEGSATARLFQVFIVDMGRRQ